MARSGLDLSLLLEAPTVVPPDAVDPGSGAVRLCPVRDGYPLVDWLLSPLPELCEREGVALVLDFAPGSIPWNDVVTFAPHRLVDDETAGALLSGEWGSMYQ